MLLVSGQVIGGVRMLFLVGFGLTVTGGVMIILYLNLIPAGLPWPVYWRFIFSQTECQLFFIGIILMLPSLYRFSKKIDLDRNKSDEYKTKTSW